MIRRLTDKTFKDGNISALKLNFAQQLHTHDMATGHNAPTKFYRCVSHGTNCVLNKDMPQQFTQLQYLATSILTDNNLSILRKQLSDKMRNQTTQSTDFLKQALIWRSGKQLKQCQYFSTQQQRSLSISVAKTEKLKYF